MTVRTIAGLPFQAHSPSLYTCELSGGTVALQYNGAGLWEVRCITLDKEETAHYYPSLASIEAVLDQRQRA